MIVRAAENPILPANGHGTKRSLRMIVCYLEASVFEKTQECVLVTSPVSDLTIEQSADMPDFFMLHMLLPKKNICISGLTRR